VQSIVGTEEGVARGGDQLPTMNGTEWRWQWHCGPAMRGDLTLVRRE
jgi:hypothetical protein